MTLGKVGEGGMGEGANYWREVAERYHHIGAPFVPPSSIASQMAALTAGCSGEGLVLGATPSFAALPAPLTACDADAAVLAALWPARHPDRAQITAFWTDMPFVQGRFHRVYGDGSLNAVGTPQVVVKVLEEVGRVLAPGGIVTIRSFASRGAAGTRQLIAKPPRAATLAALRMILSMSLALPPDYAVRPADVLSEIEAVHGTAAAFVAAAGLAPSEAATLEGARGTGLTHFYPPREVLLDLAQSVGFAARFVETAGYEGSDLCPILVLTR